MNKKETLAIIKIVVACYPNFKLEDATLTLEAWHEILQDSEFHEVKHNLKQYVRSGAVYPPVVGQLLSKPKEMRTVPNVEETRIMIEQWNKETEERQKMLQAPGKREAIEKMQADFRKKMGFPPKQVKE